MSCKEPQLHRLRAVFTILATVVALLSPSAVSVAQAQSVSAPLAVSGPAFARTATRLYVQGGSISSVKYGQFFSLDLAAPWSTSAPVWTQLNDGPQQDIYPAVFSADQKTMITFHSGATFAYRYSLSSGQWSRSSLQAQYGGYQGVNAVTDPNTGQVYLAGGYQDGTRTKMDVYDFKTDTMTLIDMPPSTDVLPNRAYYTNVWSQKRNSILYFGGYNATLKPVLENGNVVSEFVPATGAITGTPPSARADHCMAANDDGSIVVVYGGRPISGPYSGEVFILDTVNLVWQQGVPGAPRLYTTCTIAGDQLLIWGGKDSNDLVASAIVLIYSLSSKSWVTQFVPPSSYVAARASESSGTSPNPTTSNGSAGTPSHPSSSEDKPNAGAIAGGVVAGVAVICAGAPVSTTGDHDETPEYRQPSPATNAEEEEIQRMRQQLQSQQEQLDLQRRLLQLQQQQQVQQLQQPLQQQQQQQHQYQDGTYNYQPPILYSAANHASPIVTSSPAMPSHSSPEMMNVANTNGGMIHTGYADGSNHGVEVQPIIYGPPPTTSPVAAMTNKTSAPLFAAGHKHDSNFWEERSPGNPHAIIES
ncbi:Multiple epidermal growth factor-like domains protein 8 [Mortierella polycephala]|uniref:Multiple epidermal growth factor-like domains protein 8 n=1 Tax=Mortierella polycephala TaxID=41804 RepID=A0A9P6PL81_9FUNG|nr:Multiple epidermal growth factor-like domains protein 8 [Mortierella polycephala]